MAVRNFLQPLLEKRTEDPVKKRRASFLQPSKPPEQAGDGFLDELGGDDIKQKIAEAALAETMRKFGSTGRVTPERDLSPQMITQEPQPGETTRYLPREQYELLGLDPDKALQPAPKKVSGYGKVEQAAVGVAQTPVTVGPVTMMAGEWVGLFGIGAIGVQAIVTSLPIAYNALMSGAFQRNINKLSMQTKTPVDPKTAKAVADYLARQSKPDFANAAKAVKELFKPSAQGKFIPTPAATSKADAYAKGIVTRIMPEFTKTRTEDVIAGIRAGKYTGQPAPSVQAVQAGEMRLGQPAEIRKTLPTKADTDLYNKLKIEASKKGLDIEAVQGISENEYWVSISAKAGDKTALKDWLKTLSEATQKAIGMRVGGIDPVTGRVGAKKGMFAPFRNIQDAQAFLISGDISKIASSIELKGQPMTAKTIAEINRLEAERAARLKPYSDKVKAIQKKLEALDVKREEARSIQDIDEWKKARALIDKQQDKLRAELAALGQPMQPQVGQPPQAGRAELKPEVPPSKLPPTTAPEQPALPPPTGVTPEVTPTAPETGVTPPPPVSEGIPPTAEDIAVTEVSGSPPIKPPKDWDKVGGELYDKFKKQYSNPTPNTVPTDMRRVRAETERYTSDEFARLNWLGWQAELDVAMLRASQGQAGQVYKETMKAVAKSLGNNSDLLSDVDDYLMLRHQLEVLKATGRKYFTVSKGGKSQRFTAKQIGLLFAHLKSRLGNENYAKVKEAASHVPAVYNQILRGTQELTSEQIEGLIRKYPWYNPILFKSDTTPANIARKLSPRQIRELTTLETDKENISPLTSLPTTIARRMKAQAINDAKKSVAELAVDPKNKGLIGGEVEIVTKKPDGAFIDYFDNGERKYLKLGKGSEWIAEDIKLFERQPPNVIMTMVRSLQGITKMFFTTYNPGFVVWNTAFDGMVSYFSEGIGPYAYTKTLLGNIKGMFVDVPSLSEFRRGGGEMMGMFERGSREGLEFGEKEKKISSYVETDKTGQIRLRNPESLKRFINPFTLIRELGLAGENAGRRATYEKGIKEGLSPKDAALRGRRVTVDFSRFSIASRHINDWFIYFNPALQGFFVPGRAIAKDPRSLWRLGAIIAGYIALTLYNQEYDEYKDVRDGDKIGKLLIMLPSNEFNKYGQKVPHYLTLMPMREFALFTAPIEYLMGKMKTEEPEAYRTFGQEFGSLYPIVSPLSMISETGGLTYPTQIGATIKQITSNHDDFRNRPIVDDELSLLPVQQQYDQYTNKMAIRIGQAMKMSPKKLDFFISNMFGTLGGDVLRTLDWGIQQIDNELVDERIAKLVTELRDIATTVPPQNIEVARETFLEGLSAEDREIVLNMERIPEDKYPFATSIIKRFFRDYGGQVYATAKEKALAGRTQEDYPPKALEELQQAAVENAQNLLSEKITKYQYDKTQSRYRAYFAGQKNTEWREAMKEGAVSRADVDRYMPESYKRAGEFQAVSAYSEIREKYITEAKGDLDSEKWDEIEENTVAELSKHYSTGEVEYAIAHKNDWIDNLPEPARQVELDRLAGIEDESWWDNYRGSQPPKVKTPYEPYKPKQSYKDILGGTQTPDKYTPKPKKQGYRELLGVK